MISKDTHIVFDGVDLKVKQTTADARVYVNVARVVGRDRKRKLNITGGIETEVKDALSFIAVCRRVVVMQPSPCTCDYRYGHSDHAEHCFSIHVAKDRLA